MPKSATISQIDELNGRFAKMNDSSPWPASYLERELGKTSADWRVQDFVKLSVRMSIRQIALMHVGGDGHLKTLDFSPRNEKHFQAVLEGGERCDGSSLFGMLGIQAGASDIVLRPQLKTAFLDPFREQTLCVLCAHYGRDGEPLPESPDTILSKAYARLQKETKLDLTALGEVEYFLGKKPDDEDYYGTSDRAYHSTAPFVFGESVRRDALNVLAEMGIPIKYGHSEVGYIPASDKEDRIWEQHEIELNLAPLDIAAYAVTLAQWVLRNIAYHRGMRLSLEPVMLQGHPGNGLHFHFSPLFKNKPLAIGHDNNKLPDAAIWLMSGLVRYGGTLMAFGNREATSFLRLTQAKEAPNSVTWGRFNRKALVRLPIVATDANGKLVAPETIEYRLSDGSAHPQLLLAGIAQAMIAGKNMKDARELISNTEVEHASRENGHVMRIPKGFHEIATALKKDRAAFEAGNVFPAHVIDHILDALNRQRDVML